MHLLVSCSAWCDVDLLPSSVSVNDHPLVRALVLMAQTGADVNAVAGNGATPLHWAAGAGHFAACQTLLQLGADPALRSYTWRKQVFGRGSGQTALHWAAESNHTKVVELLAASSPSLIFAKDERARTPLDVASGEVALEACAALEKAQARKFVCLKLTLQDSVHGIVDKDASQALSDPVNMLR